LTLAGWCGDRERNATSGDFGVIKHGGFACFFGAKHHALCSIRGRT
jgi:hypothetical protein